MQQKQQDSQYFQVVGGWISRFFILTSSSLVVVANALLAKQGIKNFQEDPGSYGLALMRYVFAIYLPEPAIAFQHGRHF